jgi:hypothetical protein
MIHVLQDEQLHRLIAAAAYVSAHTTAQLMGANPDMTLQKHAYAK